MKSQHRIARILSTTLTAGLFLSQSLFAQQSNTQPSAGQQQAQPAQNQSPAATQNTTAAPANSQPAAPAQTQQNQPTQQQPAPPSGTTVNPSQAPLAPVTTYPDASGAPQQQQPNTTAPAATTIPENPQPKQQQQPTEPVGAAAAERVPTAGGAAAKPAGVAIAPAKQHQTRSLLIKVGAALAAGAAVGTVFALSHSSPSTPPGAGGPGVVQK